MCTTSTPTSPTDATSSGLVLQARGGTVDLFTGDPEDTALFEGIQAALDRVCCWRLNSIQYEEDTGLTHYEWRWEVPNG